MKLVVIKSNFQVLLVPNYRDLRYVIAAWAIEPSTSRYTSFVQVTRAVLCMSDYYWTRDKTKA